MIKSKHFLPMRVEVIKTEKRVGWGEKEKVRWGDENSVSVSAGVRKQNGSARSHSHSHSVLPIFL